MEPCPVGAIVTGPVVGGLRLRYSVGYPDTDGLTLVEYPVMCELRILEVTDPDAYSACQAETGFVKMVEDVDRLVGGVLQTERLCRLLQPAECPAGVQIEPDVCRAIERRPWMCPAGYKLKNEYLKCYQLNTAQLGASHLACGDGAPSFVAQSCAEYVGNDFADPPALVDCATAFTTANPPDPVTALSANSRPGTSSHYWCEFDQALLNVACHPAPQTTTECAPSTAMCLKRASETGGCSAIANTIRCRALQQAFGAGTLTASEVRNEGCEPCVVLPFSPVPPDCPRDLSREPGITGSQAFHDLLGLREDFNVGSSSCTVDNSGNISQACRAQPICTDPPRSALAWSSSHFSRRAVVNSPVILSVVDVPVEERIGGLSISADGLRRRYFTFPYPSSPRMALGDVIATYGKIDRSDGSTVDVDGMVDTYGECVYTRAPLFELTIKQLWPDNPADLAEINRLFEPAALDWWNALTTPAERQESIEARGPRYWPNLSAAERALREQELTQQVACNYDSYFRTQVWCRWTPTDTGLYRITAGGAWYGNRWDRGSRTVIQPSEVAGNEQTPQQCHGPGSRGRSTCCSKRCAGSSRPCTKRDTGGLWPEQHAHRRPADLWPRC